MIKQLRAILKNKIILITYNRLSTAPVNRTAGYTDFKTVAKRYFHTAQNTDISKSLQFSPTRDIVYFLEKECGDLFKSNLPASMLDIGCGSGIYSKIFKRDSSLFRNIVYSGCEMDKEIVDVCKIVNSQEKFFISRADKIDAISNVFDIVFCSGTLHYTLEKWKESVSEMNRVANKYVAIVRFPITKFEETFYVKQNVIGLNGIENHYFVVINKNELENYFRKIGLEILKYDFISEEYKINGISEKIILVNYLLKK